jgi:imidazolonepropionase-like amidohydrolase
MRKTLIATVLISILLAMPALRAVPAQNSAGNSQKSPDVTAIRFGKLWDGAKVITDAVVVVEGERVKSVGSRNSAVPSNVPVVDLSRVYGIPGMIDNHTHITYWADPEPRPGVRPLQTSMGLPTAVRVFMAQENARKSLEAGFTTVRDLGAQEYADIGMRDLINRGAMKGPRIFAAGYGLHVTSRTPRPGEVLVPTGGEGNGPAEVMKAVREQIAAGADVIKMFGSVGGFDNVNTNQTFTFDEMKAAVDVAHAYGKKIAIHSYGASGARDAVRAGADSLEHAVDIDDATLREMVNRGTVYIPTVAHNQSYWDNADWYGFAPGYAEKFKDYIERNKETLRRAIKAGVRIGMGSDAVFVMWGQNALDLPIYVQCGMTPEQALASTTTVNATLLPVNKALGAIAPGYYADIVGLQGDPLADINVVLKNVRWVMKSGQVMVNKLDAVSTP